MTEEAEKLLAEVVDESGGVNGFYYDEDFSRLMARPENAALRKKYPDTRSGNRVRPKD